MGSTPRVLIQHVGGEVGYAIFTPLDKEAREMLWDVVQDHAGSSLFDEGVAFAEGDAVWALMEGNRITSTSHCSPT
jgi:hypothetical protein